MKPRLFIITGPSCAGKSSIARKLLEQTRLPLVKFTTTTTRPPRSHEKNGEEYWFVSKDIFRSMIDQDAFFEWADVYDEKYGSTKKEMKRLKQGARDVLMVIDIQGAIRMKELEPEAIVICITASDADIVKRLEERGDNVNNPEARRKKIDEEQAYCQKADFTVINAEGKLEDSVQAVAEIIMKA